MAIVTGKRVTEGPYYAFCVEQIGKGLSKAELQRKLMEEKSYKVSNKVLTKIFRDVKGNPHNSPEIVAQALKTIDTLKKQIGDKNLAKAASIIERRAKLLDEVSARVVIVKKAQDRESIARSLLVNVQWVKEQLPTLVSEQDAEKRTAAAKELLFKLGATEEVLRRGMVELGLRADLERVLQGYYEIVHDVYKYVEVFISKHEVKRLVERAAMLVSQVAIEQLMKEIPEEKKVEAIKSFKTAALSALETMSKAEIEIEGVK